MSSEAVTALRSDFSVEDPWRTPAASVPVRLRRSSDGGVPRLATSVCVYFDDEFLNLVFSGADDYVLATYHAQGDPLYEEDVVEVFLAPEGLTEYYEVEVSPAGTMFEAHIVSPTGARETMKADRSWRAGAIAAIRRVSELDGTTTVDTLLRIPFAGLGQTAPSSGARWRANFFRIDRHPVRGDEYCAWRPTMRTPQDFHVPAAFGSIEFLR